LHAGLISGGNAMTAYPDRCELRLERRTLPGERPEDVHAQIVAACAAVKSRRPTFEATVEQEVYRPPSDVPADAEIVTSLVAATQAADVRADVTGVSYWADAAMFNGAGMPAVCYGPGDIALAHGTVEWIPVDEIGRATRVLERFVSDWTRA
jgi:acetylornithine deacetylase